MGRLNNKVALVTGGGSGIGRAVVERYVEEGCRVGVLERDQTRCEALNRDFDHTVVTIQGDVTSIDDNQRAVEVTVDEFGKLDVFVGNAGIHDDSISLGAISLGEIPDTIEAVYDVNVKGYILGAKAAMDEVRSSRGSMIFTASYSSFHPGTGGIFYTSSKHAVVGIIRQLAYELAPEVRVNGVAPNYVHTNLSGVPALNQGQVIDEDSGGGEGSIEDRYQLPILPPSGYAGYYVFLASENDAGATTGTVISADCGSIIA